MMNRRNIFLMGLIVTFCFVMGISWSYLFANEDIVQEEVDTAGQDEEIISGGSEEVIPDMVAFKSSQYSFLKGVKFSFNMDVAYDDNVFEYSDSDKDEYEAGTNAARFDGVDSIDDIITTLSLDAQIRKRIFESGSSICGLKIRGHIFAYNEDKTYQVYEFFFKQRFGKKNLIKIGYKYLPKYFIRTLYDRDLSRGNRYKKAEFRSDSLYVKYWQRILKNLSWWIRYTYEYKDYNDYFNERDTHSHIVGGYAGFTPWRWVKFSPYYRYFWHNAEGSDEDIGVDADISRRGYDVGLDTVFFPKDKISYLLGYAFRYTEYTTDSTVVDDPYHSGREQKRYRITARVTYKLSKTVSIYTEYEYETRNVDVSGTSASLQGEDVLEYDKNVGKIGFIWTF